MSVDKIRILLVGSGITGAATAALLRQAKKETYIEVWEKGRGTGGRMSTSRHPDGLQATLDLGAQYITLTEDYKVKRKKVYSELKDAGVLSPLTGKIEGPNNFDAPGAEHYVTPNGSSTLVKHFLKKAGVTPVFQQLVTEISTDSDRKVQVTTHDDVTQTFDAVVLTLPVPQILQLRGSIHELISSQPDVKKKLVNVSYSSRYALGLFFAPGTEVNYPWCAKYLPDDPCLRFVTVDNAKRGLASNSVDCPTMVVHTTVSFGLEHLEEDLNDVKNEIVSNVKRCLPDLPPPSAIKPHRWRYSQVHHEYEGRPGCIVLSSEPLIILAGDGFSNSTFDGCLDSADAVLEACLKHL